MLMLRLARAGSKKRPVYHLVAADRRARRDGRFIENLGYYVPSRDILVLRQDRIDHWLSVGAQATDTAGAIIKKARRKSGLEEASSKPKAPAAKPDASKKAATAGGHAPTPSATAGSPAGPGEGEAGSEESKTSAAQGKPGAAEGKQVPVDVPKSDAEAAPDASP